MVISGGVNIYLAEIENVPERRRPNLAIEVAQLPLEGVASGLPRQRDGMNSMSFVTLKLTSLARQEIPYVLERVAFVMARGDVCRGPT
jgi:acyl-CoA synthetase (AMP-forming)/AMP-acid ligase II